MIHANNLEKVSFLFPFLSYLMKIVVLTKLIYIGRIIHIYH